jgi:two-component system, response regulator YesN
MRILLVEDEPAFHKALAKMIADSGANWDVCGEAENGREAVRMVEELRPELVVTDIRMPLMDGLELLRQGKMLCPDTEFIVVTGYQDFQYAQTALRLGAMDLLVKPCSKPEIDAALARAETAVLEKQARSRKEENERQLLQESVLRALLLRLPHKQEAVAELEDKLIGRQLIVIEVSDFFPTEKRYEERDLPLLQFAVLNILGDVLEQHRLEGLALLVESASYAVFADDAQDVQRYVAAACEVLVKLLGLPVKTGHAGRIDRMKELPDSYEAMRDSFGPGGVSQRDGRAAASSAINLGRQRLIQSQVSAFVSAGQSELLAGYLERLLQTMSGMTGESWKIEALSISLALQDAARRLLELKEETNTLAERMDALNDCVDPEAASRWLRIEMDRFLSAYAAWRRQYSESTIATAMRYIEEHYAESLSLMQVASHVHLNASYFSHLFKKETGHSFVNYLVQVRMDRAKQLLRNTDLSVTEVAGIVGYDLPNYFAKLFRQSTGISPKEYRRDAAARGESG